MILQESPNIFLELIQATATHRGIPAIYVAKDYWVTRVLKRLSESQHREAVVFKGGTSLSKAYHLIERFSEDIDLAIHDGHALGDARRRTLMRAIERVATQDLTYLQGHPQESKHGRFRKTAYAFPALADNSELGQVADTLLIELNSFARPEPSATMPIATLIHDFLIEAGRTDLTRRHELEPFGIPVLCVERTLCEKIMGLVRAGHEADAIAEFRRRNTTFLRHRDDHASDAIPGVRGQRRFRRVDCRCQRMGSTIDARRVRVAGSPAQRSHHRCRCGDSLESNSVRVSRQLQGYGVRRFGPGRRRGARVPCLDWRVIVQGLRGR